MANNVTICLQVSFKLRTFAGKFNNYYNIMEYFLVIICVLLIGFAFTFVLLYQHYERKVKNQVRRARMSEQMRSAFLSNVSHALRTPLAAIESYSKMILDEKDALMRPAQVKEMASHIHQNSKDVIEYITQLRTLSNLDGDTPAFMIVQVNLAELMASYRRETVSLTKPEIQVKLRTDLSPHCKAFLDTNYMHQLMMHMLSNAARFAVQGDININYGYERRGLRVKITYTGNGQADLLGSDLYSFLQKEDALTSSKDTSALGISVCKAILDAIGGDFEMDTENGRKTIISFWFPCKLKDKHKDY